MANVKLFLYICNIKQNIMIMYELEDWCIKQHNKTNHFYDKYLPYQFHLRMVNQVYKDFKHLLPENLITRRIEEHYNHYESHDYTHHVISLATFGHDLIEDTRVSYNDIRGILGEDVADIIFALTNEKGKTRKDRANDKYYEGIRNTKGAVFVKLCDRIANVQYSKMTKSTMFDKYKEENPNFISKLGFKVELGNGIPINWDGVEDVNYLQPMVDYLDKLFNGE